MKCITSTRLLWWMILLFLFSAQLLFADQGFSPGDHEMHFMPTAYTMQKGNSYFSDYEIFVINYTLGLTDNLHISAISLVPITSDMVKSFSIGTKYRFFRNGNISSALWGSYTPNRELSNVTVGNVWSYGKKQDSIHVALGGGRSANNDSSGDWEFVYMIGKRYDTSDRLSFLIEYTNASTLLENDFNGMVTAGLRFRAQRIAWEFAAVRPLTDMGPIIFLPLLKATILFQGDPKK